jgi:hypothetical protein
VEPGVEQQLELADAVGREANLHPGGVDDQANQLQAGCREDDFLGRHLEASCLEGLE